MALTVSDLQVSAEDNAFTARKGREHAQELITTLPREFREHLHVTVGTRDKDVVPYEARLLVGRWKEGKTEGIGQLALKDSWAKGGLRGLFQ